MRVGILGSGAVGQALAIGFTKERHEVKIGTRDPGAGKLQAFSTGTFKDVAEFAELAVLCTRWDGTENAIKLAGPDSLAGKVVMDVTNPLKAAPNAPMGLALGHTDSGGEQVQRWLPGAKVVKAFNIVNAAHMYQPRFPGGPPDMFICGDDAAAKRRVSDLCRAFGWPVTDLGGLEAARLLEPLALLYVRIAFASGRWDAAWKLLRINGR